MLVLKLEAGIMTVLCTGGTGPVFTLKYGGG